MCCLSCGKADGTSTGPCPMQSNDVQVEASSALWMRLDGKDHEKGVFFCAKVSVKIEE